MSIVDMPLPACEDSSASVGTLRAAIAHLSQPEVAAVGKVEFSLGRHGGLGQVGHEDLFL